MHTRKQKCTTKQAKIQKITSTCSMHNKVRSCGEIPENLTEFRLAMEIWPDVILKYLLPK